MAEARGESLSGQIHAVLREGIIRGRYPQGSRLAEVPLAEELAVSRVPVREAIQRLQAERLVRSQPRRGAFVIDWTMRAAHEVFDLRLCLEVGAAGYAARQVAAGASVEPLLAAAEASAAGIDTLDAYPNALLNVGFHQAVADLTGNDLLASATRAMSSQVVWLFYLAAGIDPRPYQDGHRDLLRAICSGDERVAEALAYAHVEQNRADTVPLLADRGMGDRGMGDPGTGDPGAGERVTPA